MNAETYLVRWLSANLADTPVFLDVPADRPASFVSLERVGGHVTRYADTATIAVQCWALTRIEAGMLADRVALLLVDELPYAGPVARVEITGGPTDFPLDERTPRYQLTFDMTIQP